MEYTESEILQYITENDVKFIKLFFSDIFGEIKSISIQPCELERAFKTGISFDASNVKGFLSVDKSDLFLIPDPSTLSVLPWRPQHGRVVRFYCNIVYPDGSPFEGDTRHILQNEVEMAEKKGYEVKIGTECEFYLFQLDEKGNPTSIPHDNGGYCDLAPLDRGENVRRDICITLEQMGIQPEVSHHEAGPGQHEVDFKYDTPVRAADNLSTFKTIVRTVSNRNGLHADFSPKPIAEKPGNGLHINISVFKDGRNIFDDKIPTEEPKYFIAGILNHIREITAVLNPSTNSYNRLGHFEAPRYIGWSRGNRSQLIRIPFAGEASRSRIELRSPDPSCNQYAALSLLIAAGIEGIEQKAKLQPELILNTFQAEDSQLKNISTLPHSLPEALDLMKASDFVKSVLPDITVKALVQAAENNGNN
ncbi:MAG: glutamine synthetase family protein [Treponema sp.]|nr:glutamine synthetase family protein [Treponema sp.]